VTPSRASAAGGTLLTLTGSNFGLSATVSVDGNDCPLTMQSHSELRCTGPAATAGLGLPVLVSVSGLEDTSTIEYVAAACGNGVLDTQIGEVCDDYNSADYDGCSADCETENIESDDQQKCILSINKAAAKLFQAQGKVVDYCAKEASSGVGCIGTYESNALAKATTKIAFAQVGQCSTASFIDLGDVGDIEDANKDEAIALARDMFGPDPDAALVPDAMDPDRHDCQRDVLKATYKLAAARLKSFGRCKKDGLKDELIRAPGQLGDCLEATDSDAKLDKPTAAQFAAVLDSCLNRGVDPAAAFPGACATSPALAACLAEQVRCRVCRAINTTDGTDEDCDDLDDEIDNDSCQ
jgi:cysteine-rich repeat protein